MARGSIRLDHVKACPARLLKGKEAKDPRKCKCSPRVVGRLHGRDYSLGHLDPGWAKKSLGEFDDKLHDLRDPSRRKRAARSPLLRDWYGEWRVEMAAAVAHGRIARRTLAAYEQRWRMHIEKDKLAVMPINAIDVRDLRQFVSRKIASGLSHRYANELLTPISAMLTDAEIEGFIEGNPCRTPRRARHGATQRNAVYEQLSRQPAQHLERDDMRALILATPVEQRLLVLWPLATGARRAEMLAAHVDDVLWARRLLNLHYQLDDQRERVNVKAGRKREVVLWSGLERMLVAARREGALDGFIFADPNGRPVGLGSRDQILHAALDALARARGADCGIRSVTPTPRTCVTLACDGRRSST